MTNLFEQYSLLTRTFSFQAKNQNILLINSNKVTWKRKIRNYLVLKKSQLKLKVLGINIHYFYSIFSKGKINVLYCKRKKQRNPPWEEGDGNFTPIYFIWRKGNSWPKEIVSIAYICFNCIYTITFIGSIKWARIQDSWQSCSLEIAWEYWD